MNKLVDLVTLRGRFNSFTPFRQREFTRRIARDIRTDGVYTIYARNISARRIRHRQENMPDSWKPRRTTYAWHTRGSDCSPVDECYFRRTSHARPGSPSRLASPRHAAKRKARKLEPWMAWRIADASVSDTSDFSIKFSRRENLSPVTPPGKTRTATKRFPLRSPRDSVKRVSSGAIMFSWYLFGSTNEETGLLWYTYFIWKFSRWKKSEECSRERFT